MIIKVVKYQNPPSAIKKIGVKKLIVQSTKILKNWDEKTNVLVTQYEINENSQLYF